MSEGSVSLDELVEALTPMGSNKTEIDQMVKAADANGEQMRAVRFAGPQYTFFVKGDGVVSFKEFLSAFHRNEWFKVCGIATKYWACCSHTVCYYYYYPSRYGIHIRI